MGRLPAVAHPTVAERTARGRALRETVPRSSHAELDLGSDRSDPVALLAEQAETRAPDLVPIRHGRMLASPFAFFRGAALVMAADLATTPSTGLRAQVCGDAHLSNFGVYASPDRRLVFDCNDFDETLPGPWEWDLKRLAASLAIAGRGRGFSTKERRRILRRTASSYVAAMRGFAELGNLEVFYSRADVEQVIARVGSALDERTLERLGRFVDKAHGRDSVQAFDRLTETGPDDQPRIRSDPPLVVPLEDMLPSDSHEELVARMRNRVRQYRRSLRPDCRYLLEQYEVVHMAHKVVGVGSVGTRAFILLLVGRDTNDPLFLQMKEAQQSVLERFVGHSAYPNSGQRVVVGQQVMQAASDIFLGWERAEGIDGNQRDFYVRQLRDWKGSADVDRMVPTSMEVYGRLCAWTLARAHATSGDRVAIAAYLGRGGPFPDAIAEFAESYADQSERDHDALAAAVADGRMAAVSGV